MFLLRDFTCRLLAGATLVLATLSPVLADGGGGGGGGGGGTRGDVDMPGEILLKLRSGDGLPALLSKYPVTLVSRFGARPIFRVKVIGTARVKDVLAGMALEPGVMIAETNPTHSSPEARGNQPWTIGSPQAYVTQWAPQAMHLPPAHGIATGAGIRIAVLDTGVDRGNRTLGRHLVRGFDFVDFDADPSEAGGRANAGYGHGTHVAGLLAMVAPDAQIMPIRVLNPDGVGNAWVLAEALLYAVDPDGNPNTDDGAHVINLSLGSLTRTRLFNTLSLILSCGNSVPDDPLDDLSDDGYSADRSRCAAGNGAVIVAAAGNDGSSGAKEYPAAEGAHGLLAVGASNVQSRLAGFSNSGSWIDIAAPGEGLTSWLPGGVYGTWSGTSMAAPMAAGTAALVRSMNVKMSPEDVIRRVKRASAMLCGTNFRRVDALAAVTNVVPPDIVCN